MFHVFYVQICQYCYDDFMDKNYQQTKGSSAVSNLSLSDESSSEGSITRENDDAAADDGAEAKDGNA